LPRWVSVSTTGDENEPVLSEGDLEEKNLLDVTVLLDETTVGQEHGTVHDPGADSKQDSENNRDDPDLGELPFDRAGLVVGIVVGDSDGSQIGEKSEEDDKLDTNSLVENDHGSDEVDFQMKTEGDTVLDVGLHALENLAGNLDGGDNGG
jgi:hypothetical protein